MASKLTPELIEKAKQAKSPEELLTFAKENGTQLTAEEANTYFAKLNPKMGELTDDELDNVAGGGCHTKDGRMVVSAIHYCRGFICKKCDCGLSGHETVCKRCRCEACCNGCKYCTYEKGLWLCNNPQNMK